MMTRTPRPTPSEITYDRVRDLVVDYAKKHNGAWLSTNNVIDLMNGWDGQGTYRNKSLERARKKLQQNPGTNVHETPTSGQMSTTRRQLDKLVEEKLVEKARGHTDGNNSWGYRWITDALKTKQANQQEVSARAKDLARRLSLALGGDGESGVKPFLTPNDTIGIRVHLYDTTAERLLTVLEDAGVSSDFFSGKHWEILTSSGDVMGCTSDRADVRREEPDAVFRQVKPDECAGCRGDIGVSTVMRFKPVPQGPCPECVEYGECSVHPRVRQS